MTAQVASGAGFSPAKMLQAGYAQEEIGEALAALRGGGLTATQAYAKGYSAGATALVLTLTLTLTLT